MSAWRAVQAYTPQSHGGDDRAASALPHMIAAAEAAADALESTQQDAIEGNTAE